MKSIAIVKMLLCKIRLLYKNFLLEFKNNLTKRMKLNDDV